jgi:hypothetical protein
MGCGNANTMASEGSETLFTSMGQTIFGQLDEECKVCDYVSFAASAIAIPMGTWANFE